MKHKKIGIIGGGRFGMTLAQSLAARDVDVILVDNDWDLVQSLSDSSIRAIRGDGTNPETLKEAGFASCSLAVVAIASSLECSTLATINCKDLGIRTVVAKASSDLHGRVLEKIGADIVVYPDRDRAYRRRLQRCRDGGSQGARGQVDHRGQRPAGLRSHRPGHSPLHFGGQGATRDDHRHGNRDAGGGRPFRRLWPRRQHRQTRRVAETGHLAFGRVTERTVRPGK